ncbi:MAG: amidohydrolase [Alphaproteobacteria bacterium]|nr:MAG: amidohydrolase [Alphaproteobacteria bacterium]
MASCSKDADSLFNDTADLVFTNGNIYTVNTDTPWVQSVGIKDGRIVALGSDAETAKWVGPQTKTVNLHGKLAMPSFGDAHVHPIFGGLSFAQCSLHNGRSVDAYIAIIKKCLAETPGDDLLFGRGWGPGYFPPDGVPHKNILDALAPDRPVVIQSTGGHSYWVNSKALALANITKDTPDPAKGRIDRDPVTGEAVGGLQETAKDIIQPFIPAPTDVEMQNAILYTVKLFNSLGITNWYDAGIDDIKPDGESATLDAYTEVKAQGKLTTHVSIALKWDNDKSLDQIPTLYAVAKRAGAAGFSANGIKLYTDGVIVQRTAAVLEPYVDTKDDLGELSIPVQELNDIVTKLDHDGFQVYVHSIGDRAVHETLNAFERARSVNGSNDNRHFIAHLNLVAPADQPRFSTLNVAANFQPLWASDDPYMRLTAERLGPERMQYIYPANSILQAGGRLVYGADWSVASADPLLGIEVALTRKPTDRPEAKALLAHEGVTLAQAIKAYTLDVAFITHREDETGSLEIGKSADLIVIDQNLFIIPVNDISDSKVILTLFKGQTVYGSLSGL